MKKIAVVVIFLVFIVPYRAFGQQTGHVVSQDLGLLVSNVSCTASASARTITFKQGQTAGYEVLSFQIEHEWNSATSLEMYCESSQTNQSTWGTLQSCQKSGAVFSCTDAILSHPLIADDSWIFRFDIVGSPNIRCLWSCTAGAASDTVTMHGRASSP